MDFESCSSLHHIRQPDNHYAIQSPRPHQGLVKAIVTVGCSHCNPLNGLQVHNCFRLHQARAAVDSVFAHTPDCLLMPWTASMPQQNPAHLRKRCMVRNFEPVRRTASRAEHPDQHKSLQK